MCGKDEVMRAALCGPPDSEMLNEFGKVCEEGHESEKHVAQVLWSQYGFSVEGVVWFFAQPPRVDYKRPRNVREKGLCNVKAK